MSENTNFEKALKSLEEVVALLEKGETTLDESIALYEKGMANVKECRAALKNAEIKITNLSEVE